MIQQDVRFPTGTFQAQELYTAQETAQGIERIAACPADLRALGPDDLARRFKHPEMGETLNLATQVALYAWHGDHHVAHITGLRRRMDW